MIKTQSYEDRQSLLETGWENTKTKIIIITIIIKTERETDGGREGRDGGVDGGAVRVISGGECVCVSVCLHMFYLQVCVSMWQKLGGIERALTLCLYGPTVNGDKGPACCTAQPDDVTAHVPGQLGEACGLQQESLLGLHGGLGAAAVSHWHHVVGLPRSVTP